MKFTFIVALFTLIQTCTNKSSTLDFREFFPAKQDSLYLMSSGDYDIIRYFIIRNYKDSHECDSLIEQFSRKNKPEYFHKYRSYQEVYYKESNKTNHKNLKAYPKDLYRYSQENDMVYTLSWIKDKFLERVKIVDGMPVPTNNSIKVYD